MPVDDWEDVEERWREGDELEDGLTNRFLTEGNFGRADKLAFTCIMKAVQHAEKEKMLLIGNRRVRYALFRNARLQTSL